MVWRLCDCVCGLDDAAEKWSRLDLAGGTLLASIAVLLSFQCASRLFLYDIPPCLYFVRGSRDAGLLCCLFCMLLRGSAPCPRRWCRNRVHMPLPLPRPLTHALNVHLCMHAGMCTRRETWPACTPAVAVEATMALGACLGSGSAASWQLHSSFIAASWQLRSSFMAAS